MILLINATYILNLINLSWASLVQKNFKFTMYNKSLHPRLLEEVLGDPNDMSLIQLTHVIRDTCLNDPAGGGRSSFNRFETANLIRLILLILQAFGLWLVFGLRRGIATFIAGSAVPCLKQRSAQLLWISLVVHIFVYRAERSYSNSLTVTLPWYYYSFWYAQDKNPCMESVLCMWSLGGLQTILTRVYAW